MNIQNLLNYSEKLLDDNSNSTVTLDSEILLGKVIKKNRE